MVAGHTAKQIGRNISALGGFCRVSQEVSGLTPLWRSWCPWPGVGLCILVGFPLRTLEHWGGETFPSWLQEGLSSKTKACLLPSPPALALLSLKNGS